MEIGHKLKNKEEDIKEMIRLYLDGFSTYKLAKLFDCSPPTIRNVLRRNNIKIGKTWKHVNFLKEINNMESE